VHPIEYYFFKSHQYKNKDPVLGAKTTRFLGQVLLLALIGKIAQHSLFLINLDNQLWLCNSHF